VLNATFHNISVILWQLKGERGGGGSYEPALENQNESQDFG